MQLANSRGVVFTADGAGNFGGTSVALRRALAKEGSPLVVEKVEWSHGYGRVLADQIDYRRAREEGQCLADRVAALRQACPDGEIYLVGHSAGSGVVLAAAEALPPGSVDRIVLLAPAVSADYDLRPALGCVRLGIDVFTSRRDLWSLGVATALFGPADRQQGPAAGRVGFRPVIALPDDAVLYEKLRQHPWHPYLEWAGNGGGHYGSHRPEYFRAYVLPLLASGEPGAGG